MRPSWSLYFKFIVWGNSKPTVQLALEQHRFEMHSSTYTWTFFISKYCSTTRRHPQMAESLDIEELQI